MVVFLCVLFKIWNINLDLENYFKCNIYDMFFNDYCLEYFLILKELYPNGKMVIERNKDHCAILINDVVYDVLGVEDNNLFYIALEDDENYVYSFYKKFDLNEKLGLQKYLNHNSKTLKY